jgi:hypothetical protein
MYSCTRTLPSSSSGHGGKSKSWPGLPCRRYIQQYYYCTLPACRPASSTSPALLLHSICTASAVLHPVTHVFFVVSFARQRQLIVSSPAPRIKLSGLIAVLAGRASGRRLDRATTAIPHFRDPPSRTRFTEPRTTPTQTPRHAHLLVRCVPPPTPPSIPDSPATTATPRRATISHPRPRASYARLPIRIASHRHDPFVHR